MDDEMNELQIACFQIIAAVGTARTGYIEAIHLAKARDFDAAVRKVEEARGAFAQGHAVHADLVQRTAAGENLNIDLLLVHAEDQLMSAEGFGILANEFIELYRAL